ncbi:MAG: hypothetical protein IPP42_04755 [Saprospiraceae bacterium]|nr:hypothetical protein [Saprospiraceae bacterium]
MLSMLMVIGALLVTMLLFFTPVKRLIPGYGNTNHDDYTNLYKKVQTLEKGMEAQTSIFRKCKA